MGGDPVGQLLAPVGLGVEVARSPERADEELGLADLAGVRV